jgi:nucleotide-binding universal stress UspA family protein
MTIVVGHLATREGRAALDAAVAEAELRSTGLLVVVTEKGDDGSPSGQAEQLADLRRDLDARGVRYEISDPGQARDVAENLISAAEQHGGTLIVIGLCRRSPVGKLILGVNAQRILLDSPCPVLAVKPGGNDDQEPVVKTE